MKRRSFFKSLFGVAGLAVVGSASEPESVTKATDNIIVKPNFTNRGSDTRANIKVDLEFMFSDFPGLADKCLREVVIPYLDDPQIEIDYVVSEFGQNNCYFYYDIHTFKDGVNFNNITFQRYNNILSISGRGLGKRFLVNVDKVRFKEGGADLMISGYEVPGMSKYNPNFFSKFEKDWADKLSELAKGGDKFRITSADGIYTYDFKVLNYGYIQAKPYVYAFKKPQAVLAPIYNVEIEFRDGHCIRLCDEAIDIFRQLS